MSSVSKGKFFLAILSVLILVALWGPMFFILNKGASVEGFLTLFQKDEIWDATKQSLGLATVSSFFSVLFGTMIAFAIPKVPKKWQERLNFSLVFPMILPEIAFGLALMVFFVKLGIPLGWQTLLFSHVAFSLSYSTLLMKIRVESLDLSLIDAAKDLGATPLVIFKHALLPQLIPSMAAAFVTSFALSLDDFLVSFFVKGIDQRTLPIQIYSMMRLGVKNEIYSLFVILFCISIAVVLSTQLWLKKGKKL